MFASCLSPPTMISKGERHKETVLRAHHLTRAGTDGSESGRTPGPTGNHTHGVQSLVTESWAREGW